MTLNGLILAKDGIGYGGLTTAKDGFNSLFVKTSNLTICPPSLISYSTTSILDSSELDDLVLLSVLILPNLTSHNGLITIDSIQLGIEDLSSITYPPILTSHEYTITIDSVELKPSGVFDKCQ